MHEAALTGSLPKGAGSVPSLRAMVRFWGCCLPHVLLAPVAMLGITFLHELAHAAAVLVLGGRVTAFTFIPQPSVMGQVWWSAGTGWGAFETDLVSIAPYLTWSALAATVLVVAALPNRLHWAVASTLFLWGFAAPVVDIAWNLLSTTGDFAFPGVDGLLLRATGGTAVLVAYVLGFWVQRRLFPQLALSATGYLVSTLVLGGAFASAGLITLAAFGL